MIHISSCILAETRSESKEFNIIIIGKEQFLKMYIYNGSGKYNEIVPVQKIYYAKIPSMSGGFSSF